MAQVPGVRNSAGELTPFAADHFAGTLVRLNVSPEQALRASAMVEGILHGSGTAAVTTAALRAATAEILGNAEQVDAGVLRRLLVPTKHESGAISITLSQRSIRLDGKESGRSDWGALSISYLSFKGIAYFNVAVGERWIIRNAPLFPALGGGRLQTLLYFDLGVKPGIRVTSLEVATSISMTVATQPPTEYALRPVAAVNELYWTNFIDRPFPPLGAPPSGYVGGSMGEVFYCRLNYPNQPCGKNECAPAAVSNSVKWLKKKYHLDIPDEQTTIDYWKDGPEGTHQKDNPLGWTPSNGVPHGEWGKRKAKWMHDHQIPIDTYPQDGAKIADVLGQFNGTSAPPPSDEDSKLGRKPNKNEQAVEMDAGCHVAAVICMSGPDSNGNYHLRCASDTLQQGQAGPGKPEEQQVVVSPTGDLIDPPAPWQKGDKVHNFVVQCPHPKKS